MVSAAGTTVFPGGVLDGELVEYRAPPDFTWAALTNGDGGDDPERFDTAYSVSDTDS